ncbi:hypothetical protein [Paraflavitalea speifideaquila]|uniref:hypothetical protein n=1 Tax=Paraflavitalea speifideaquila TaxID=3076558 RepID=UPI0028E5760C|nr:hypothetical protein [Paraflavitalea speifideiaquila]
MNQVQFNAEGGLIITPSASSSQHDFDFLQGRWLVRNRKLKTRLNNCSEWIEFAGIQDLRKILLGIGNIDILAAGLDGKPFEGMTLRLFNPVTRLWSIYWADSNRGQLEPPVLGSFEDKVGRFITKDSFQGRDILVQFNWDATNPELPVWSQAFSADQGATWEWNWYMYFSRADQ